MRHSGFRKIGARIGLIVVMLLAMMTILVVLDIGSSQRSMRNERAQSTRRLVEVAATVVGRYADEQRSGRLTREQAQAAAALAVSVLRYDGSGYFWINDLNGRLIMHPIRPKLDGTDGRLIVDANGRSAFGQAADVARHGGSGFFGYLFPRPGTTKPVQKLSYATLFGPWGWVIASGAYVDDIDAAVWALSMQRMRWLVLIALSGAAIAYLIARSIVGPIRSLTAAMQCLAGGDKAMAVPDLCRRDEVGSMAAAVQVFKDNMIETAASRRSRSPREPAARNARTAWSGRPKHSQSRLPW